jgi:hypothetical protein
MLVGMFLILVQLIIICNMISAFPFDPWDLYLNNQLSDNEIAVFFWLNIEIVGVAGLVMSNVVFLLIRSIVRHKVS